MQLDLFAPAPVAPPAHVYAPRITHDVQTRAYQHGGTITVYSEEDPEPFEMEVRGIPCVISWSGGFCTHAIGGPGSPFWSDTGFRSFGHNTLATDEIEALICGYIDAPVKSYGCGGKLDRWWPGYILQWRQSLRFEIEMTKRDGRAGVWNQWGPEKWTEHWGRHDERLADALDRMRADGIDPDDVGPGLGFKGSWPRFGASH